MYQAVTELEGGEAGIRLLPINTYTVGAMFQSQRSLIQM